MAFDKNTYLVRRVTHFFGYLYRFFTCGKKINATAIQYNYYG